MYAISERVENITTSFGNSKIKGIIHYFARYSYSLSCQGLDEKIIRVVSIFSSISKKVNERNFQNVEVFLSKNIIQML